MSYRQIFAKEFFLALIFRERERETNVNFSDE